MRVSLIVPTHRYKWQYSTPLSMIHFPPGMAYMPGCDFNGESIFNLCLCLVFLIPWAYLILLAIAVEHEENKRKDK